MINKTYILFFIFSTLVLVFGCKKKKVTEDLNILFAPSELIAKVVSSSQVDLKWVDKSTNETGFKVERRIGTAQYAFLATVGPNLSVYTDNTVQANTSYTYRVYSFNSKGNSLTYSNEVTVQTPGLTPVVNTIDISDTSASSATAGGDITSEGGRPILERGVVWGTTQNPTIENSQRTKDSIGVGKFKSSITGLNAETTYYVRAYAKNTFGVSYGNQLQFKTKSFFRVGNGVKDVEGTTYKTVLIGNQEWMAENLKTLRLNNGEILPNGGIWTNWRNYCKSDISAYVDPEVSSINGEKYGRLYNYFAVNDKRKLCPVGWHIPTLSEWNTLENYLGKDSIGPKLKATEGWDPISSYNGNNSSGMSFLPAGEATFVGTGGFNGTAIFWTYGEVLPRTGSFPSANFILLDGKSFVLAKVVQDNWTGASVRCVKD